MSDLGEAIERLRAALDGNGWQRKDAEIIATLARRLLAARDEADAARNARDEALRRAFGSPHGSGSDADNLRGTYAAVSDWIVASDMASGRALFTHRHKDTHR